MVGCLLSLPSTLGVKTESKLPQEQREDLQTTTPKLPDNLRQPAEPNTHKQSQSVYSQADDAMGSLLSVFTPKVEGSDNKQPTIKPKKKKKRRYGRQW